MIALVLRRARTVALPRIAEAVAGVRFGTAGGSLLRLLIATDLLLLLTHVLHTHTGYFADPDYSLNAERGFAGMVQGLQLLWISAILFQFFIWRRNLFFLSWFLLFGYLLLDDWFSVHERVGEQVALALGMDSGFGLRAQDLGELVVYGSTGAVLLAVVVLGYLRGDSAHRAIGRSLALLMAALIAFGVGADMVHSILMFSWADEAGLILEEGGEMLALSLICGYLFALLGERRGGRRAADRTAAMGAAR
jgi:hypothetical protein